MYYFKRMNNTDNNKTTSTTQANLIDNNKMIRAKEIVSFLIHLFWFLIVNILIYILDYSSNMKIEYAYFVTLGWGIGLASHAFRVIFSSQITEYVYNKLK